jgi:hypothetical protein
MVEVTAFVAEFQKDARGRLELWSLVTFEDDGRGIERRYYDVDWCKKFGCYVFDYSGGGGSHTVEVGGIYFAKGPVSIIETPSKLVSGADHPPWTSPLTLAIQARNRTWRLKALPQRFRSGRNGNLLDWLENNGIQQPSVYCSECDDRFPDDQACEHIWWCEEACWWSTPSERCGCGTRADCSGEFRDNNEKFAFSPNHPGLREDRLRW